LFLSAKAVVVVSKKLLLIFVLNSRCLKVFEKVLSAGKKENQFSCSNETSLKEGNKKS